MNTLEVDFVAEKGKEKLYIQVAYVVNTEEVFWREFGNLEKIDDNYPKYVLSLDDVLIEHKGIVHQKVWEFLSV
jgi:predicted AAA+ superfamily ATPase